MEKVKASAKSFTVCFLGLSDLELPDNAELATTLKAAARSALGGRSASEGFDPAQAAVGLPKGKNEVVGLFSGGTLCAEAQFVFCDTGEKVCSNVAIPGAAQLGKDTEGHRFIDLGDDEHTCGRPHPMIDPAVRDDIIQRTINDPAVGIVLVDVVLGYGAHEDPAGHLVSSLKSRKADGPLVIASITGTDADIQDRSSQVKCLESAGILVAPPNADAALLALACMEK